MTASRRIILLRKRLSVTASRRIANPNSEGWVENYVEQELLVRLGITSALNQGPGCGLR